MILKQTHNTPIAAPQFSNMASALSVFRVFKDNSVYQMSDLLSFIASPSHERDEFLTLFSVQYINVNNIYIKQIYS